MCACVGVCVRAHAHLSPAPLPLPLHTHTHTPEQVRDLWARAEEAPVQAYWERELVRGQLAVEVAGRSAFMGVLTLCVGDAILSPVAAEPLAVWGD